MGVQAQTISDREAKRIAQEMVDVATADPASPIGVFAATGEIEATLARNAEQGGCYMGSRTVPNELWAYAAAAGQRPAVPGWDAL